MHTYHDCRIRSMMISVHLGFPRCIHKLTISVIRHQIKPSLRCYFEILIFDIWTRNTTVHQFHSTKSFFSTRKITHSIRCCNLTVGFVQFVCTCNLWVIGLTAPIVSGVIYTGLYKPAVGYLVQLLKDQAIVTLLPRNFAPKNVQKVLFLW